jgi:hypothetical protein
VEARRFLLEGKPVTLARPAVAATPAGPRTTASGSVAAPGAARAKAALASRIWVEGIHDAELLEHVWGDDLRDVGIVVEPMHGIDDLAAKVASFGPRPGMRLGILVDHLVPGSKEARLTAGVSGPHVLVTGHPFVDVWAGCGRGDAGGVARCQRQALEGGAVRGPRYRCQGILAGSSEPGGFMAGPAP